MAMLAGMTQSKEPARPFLEEGDAAILAGFINRIAESFDVAELTTEEALLAYLLLDRAMGVLWDKYKRELIFVFKRTLAPLGDDDEGPDDDSQS
jgi:hypothetical protein